ncbi:MAG TPA: efflux RND transporter periplasmic adaptor subunit, partial [Thermoanaerobaculia bacterium]|nr:efflux RND transporter periplasmic adaptor subunit [Thermoanaerobaculia bacterium]
MRRITATLLLLLPLLLSCKRGKKDEAYKTEKVDRGSVTMTVTATGTLSAVTTVQIGSQVSGVISQLYADFNSQVKQGQLLAELDPTPFQAQVEQRRADMTRAQVQTEDTRIKYDRQKRLLESGLAAQADVDAAKAQFDSARAQVQQAAAALSQSQTNLRYTRITSPTDGVVVDKKYEVGQTVAASFQAPTLFEIAQDLTKMQVQADVDQSDIGRIQVGQVARFNVDAYPDEEFRGRIAQIRYNAQVNQNVVTYPVILEVDNPEGRLRPKMTANVTIDVSTVQNVLRVPNAALRFKPPQDENEKKAAGGAGSGGDATERAARFAIGVGHRGGAFATGGRRGDSRGRLSSIRLSSIRLSSIGCRLVRRREIGGVGFESQRGIRNAEHVSNSRDVDRDVSRHLRAELLVGVRHFDDDGIGDHVLRHHRVEADLRDAAAELLIGIGV